MIFRWLDRLSRGKAVLAVIGAVLVGFFVVLNASMLTNRSPPFVTAVPDSTANAKMTPLGSRARLRTTSHELEEYCSPAFTASSIREGGGMDAGVRLHNVLLLVRHGDRTPIHTLNNSRFVTQKEYYAPSAFEYRKLLAKFKLVPLADDEREPPLHTALDPRSVFTVADHESSPGTLTTWGFMQHVDLGQGLANAYRNFLMTLDLHKDIYIRSTHYARTIQSVAGFMIGLLGNDLAGYTGQMPIQAFMWDIMEYMHGSGLRSTGKIQGEQAEHMHWVEGPCKRAVEHAATQHQAIHPRPQVMKQLAGLFGQEVYNMKMTELTDAVIPAYCHGEPLPCSHNGCLNIELLKEMKRDSDRMYCERYWGSQGGLNATKLSHYQLVSEIATRVRESATGKSHLKFSVLSGHDTVIAPVLTALGVTACGWPPYASRLTFETWTTAREGAATKLEDTYIRVLFNGKVVTTSIPGCVTASNQHPAIASMRAKAQLCPLPTLFEHITSLLQPYIDLQSACNAEQ